MQEQLIFTLVDQVIDKEKHWPLPRKGRKAWGLEDIKSKRCDAL